MNDADKIQILGPRRWPLVYLHNCTYAQPVTAQVRGNHGWDAHDENEWGLVGGGGGFRQKDEKEVPPPRGATTRPPPGRTTLTSRYYGVPRLGSPKRTLSEKWDTFLWSV